MQHLSIVRAGKWEDNQAVLWDWPVIFGGEAKIDLEVEREQGEEYRSEELNKRGGEGGRVSVRVPHWVHDWDQKPELSILEDLSRCHQAAPLFWLVSL